MTYAILWIADNAHRNWSGSYIPFHCNEKLSNKYCDFSINDPLLSK